MWAGQRRGRSTAFPTRRSEPAGTLIGKDRTIRNTAANAGGGLWNGSGDLTATGLTIDDPDANTAPTGPVAFNNAAPGTMSVNGTNVPPGSGI